MDIKRVGDHTIWKCVYSGAIHGVIAWTVYAIVECWFSYILPWTIKPGHAYKLSQWEFTAILFVIYQIFGLILGGLSGFCIRTMSGRIPFLQNAQTTEIFQASAISTVVLAFAINLVFQLHIKLTVSALLLISMLLLLGIVLSMRSMVWSRRLRFITNPWTTIILLLGLSWLTLELFNSQLTKGISALAYILVILLISFFIQKIADRRQINKSDVTVPSFQIKSIACLTFIWLITFGISLFLKQTPLQVDSSVMTLPMDDNHPNVILITMDTVRADHLSLHGYERDTTPFLREFAKEATLYTHASTSGDMTLPTHASIFTGMYAKWHKAHLDPWNGYPLGRPLDVSFNTLAEVLSNEGYFTMGVVANAAYVSRRFGMAQGFRHYDQRMSVPFLRLSKKFYLMQCVSNIIKYVILPDYDSWITRDAEEISKEVYTLLNKVKKENERFFLFINYMDAHWPYTPPPPFDTRYPGKDVTYTSAKHSSIVREVMKLERKVTDEEYNHMVSQYDGGIAYIDYSLEKLISRLKELGLYDNSLIIITSDHGEAFGERNLMGHEVSAYQHMVYVPLIIKYPKAKKGHVADKLASSVDLMPTILDVLGYKIPEDVQGISLINVTSKSKEIISESFPGRKMLDLHPRFNRIERAIFSGPYKFISSTAGKKELYNLLQDPSEMQDLYIAENNIAMELEAKLNRWVETKVPGFKSPAKVEMDKDTRDRLKALGYIQ